MVLPEKIYSHCYLLQEKQIIKNLVQIRTRLSCIMALSAVVYNWLSVGLLQKKKADIRSKHLHKGKNTFLKAIYHGDIVVMYGQSIHHNAINMCQ